MTGGVDPFNVEALEKSVNDSAVRASTIWVSYLLFALYLVVAAGAVTQRQLLLENPIKLPALNIDLPLVGFFFVAPVLFVIFHFYVLVQVLLLARTAETYNDAIERSVGVASDRNRVRQRLANTLFAQLFAGSPREREGLLGAFLRVIAWTTLAIAPALVLLTFQVQFLPYHSSLSTWSHRVLIGLDLMGVLLLWQGVVAPNKELLWRALVEQRAATLTAIVLVLFSGFVVSFPGELHTNWMRLGDRVPSDCNKLLSMTIFMDRLSLPNEILIDTEKLAKIETATKASGQLPYEGERTGRFDGRDLSCGVFRGADLRSVSFSSSSANLRGANFNSAQLQGAVLSDAQLQSASFLFAKLQGASLGRANLQGASLHSASLDGASLDSAHLEGADVSGAELEGAALAGAHAEGASFFAADLQGAIIERASLQGASFDNAILKGAKLSRADLRGATFVHADLQGASLQVANLDSALLNQVLVWRADIRSASTDGARIVGVDLRSAQDCRDRTAGCELASVPVGEIIDRLRQNMPEGRWRDSVLADVGRRLDPAKPLAGEQEMAKEWANLQNTSAPPNAYEEILGKQWNAIGCTAAVAPYVLNELARRLASDDSPFDGDSAQTRRLATSFLDRGCRGSRGISELTKATLEKIRDQIAQQPAHPSQNQRR